MVNLAGGPNSFSFHFGLSNQHRDAESQPRERNFSAANLLALLFEGNQPGALSHWLERHPGQSFREAWSRGLTDGERQTFEQTFGRETAASLVSLSQESDPTLFCEALLGIAGRLESSERLEAAGLLYQVVQNANVSTSLNDRARARLDAIQGRGDGWTRASFLGQRLLAQASEPSTLIGMGVAGMVGRTVRLGVLSRLAVSPAGVLTRGFGARTVAATTALALEAPAFTASTRGVNVLLGRPQDWSRRGLWREFASGATTLFGLKVSGAVGGALIRRYAQGESLLARTGQVAISQSAMLGGIYASHRAEQALGFRDHVDGETTAVDTVSTWIQFNLAGALSRRVMGESFRQAELSMERRTEILASQNQGNPALPNFANWRAQLSRSAPLAASMAACLTGCSVAGEHSNSGSTLAMILGGIGILAAARRGSSNQDTEAPANPAASTRLLFPQSRRVQVLVGSSSLEMEARADQEIHDRLLGSYEIALRDLLEGTETGFAMLQGEVADRLRSDQALRQRILDASAPSLSQRRVRAVVGPSGHLLGVEFIEAIGSPDSSSAITQSRRVQVQVGSSSLEMEARAEQAIHDRLMSSYEIALRDLLEGTETGFAMLQGEVADRLRSDQALRQRILDASTPSLSQRRVRATVGPAGRLVGVEFIEAIGSLDGPPQEAAANQAPPAAAQPQAPAQEGAVSPVVEPHAEIPKRRSSASPIADRLRQLETRADRPGEPAWTEVAARGQRIFERLTSENRDLLLSRLQRALNRSRAMTPASAIDNLFRVFEETLDNRRSSDSLTSAVQEFIDRENRRSRHDGSLPSTSETAASTEVPAAPVHSNPPAATQEVAPESPRPQGRPTRNPALVNLVESLRPQLASLEQVPPEQRWQNLFELWRHLEPRPSTLGIFASAVEDQIFGGRLGGTRNLSFIIDRILQNWMAWEPHYRALVAMPESARMEYCDRNFRREDDSGYSSTYLRYQIQVGTWLWNNRARFGLATGDQSSVQAAPIPETPSVETLSPIPRLDPQDQYQYREAIIQELGRLNSLSNEWSEVRLRTRRLLIAMDGAARAPQSRSRTASNLYYTLRTQRSGATPAAVLGVLALLEGAFAEGRDQSAAYFARAELRGNLQKNSEFFRYRNLIQSRLGEVSVLGEAWDEVAAQARRIYTQIEAGLPNRPFSPFAAEYLYRILGASQRGAGPEAISNLLSRLEREVAGYPEGERVAVSLGRMDNEWAVQNSRTPASTVNPAVETAEPPTPSIGWSTVRSRIEDFRSPDYFQGQNPRSVAAAQRILDTIERLETNSSFTPYDAELLLNRYEEELNSDTPNFESIHQQRRAMTEQSATLSQLHSWQQNGASEQSVIEAHRTFHRLFHPAPLDGARLSEFIWTLLSILQANLSADRQIASFRELQNAVAENRAPVLDLGPSEPDSPTPQVETPTAEAPIRQAEAPAPVDEPPPPAEPARILSIEEFETSIVGLGRAAAARRLIEYFESLFFNFDMNSMALTPRLSRAETVLRVNRLRGIARRDRLWGENPFRSEDLTETTGLSRSQRRAIGRILRRDSITVGLILENSQGRIGQPTGEISPPASSEPDLPSPPVAASPRERESVLPPASETLRETEGLAPPPAVSPEMPAPLPPPPPSTFRLADLLGRPGDSELIRIERFIEGDHSHQRDALPPSLERLREIQGNLRQLSDLEPRAREARDSLATGIEELIRGPSSESLVEFTRRALPLSPASAEIYEALSPLAREGFYLLVVAMRGENRRQLDLFLDRCQSPQEANQILETVALLHDRGVRGYENAFVPTGRDEKFLSTDSSRINSLQAENTQALRLAGLSNVRRLWLSQRMSINWSRLTEADRQLIEEQVLPALGRTYRYDQQRSVEVDAGYQTTAGGNRIVEVKTSRAGTLNPQGEQAAYIVLQAFRHALLVRQHGLEGVEYILEAPTVSATFVSSLENVLNRLNVPFIIRVHETQSRNRRTVSSRMDATEGESRASQDRLRPLPLPANTRISSLPPPAPAEESVDGRQWAPAAVDFLNRGLLSSDQLSRRSSREEALDSFSYLPEPVMSRVLESLNRFLREESAELTPASRHRVSELMERLRTNPSGRKIGRTRAGIIFDIAALATRVEVVPEVQSAPRSPNQPLRTYLQFNAASFDAHLTSIEKALEGLEELARDNEPGELREYLEEYSPDVPLTVTQGSQGQGGWTLRGLLNQLQRPEMQGFRETYGQRLENIIESWETLRSSLLLGE